MGQLLVEAGIVDRDGRLVGEAGQHLAVVSGEVPTLGAEDVDRADEIALHDQGQGHHLVQAQADGRHHQPQLHLQIRDRPADEIFAFSVGGDIGQQGCEEVQEVRRQAIAGLHLEAAILLAQGDEARLAPQHLHGVLQDQP